MGTTTPNFNLYKPAVSETGWGTLVDGNWDTIDSNLTNALPRSYLAGMTTSNNGGSPTTRIDISAGQAQDAANAGAMTLSSTLTKDITATWAVGSGNGGRGTGVSLSTNTWYHVFVIKRTDTQVVDAYFDTSISAANIPSPYTLFRRIASIKTDGGSLILAYSQFGDEFLWSVATLDMNNVASSATAALQTVTVPPGVQVRSRLRSRTTAPAGSQGVLLTSPDESDQAASITAAPLADLSAGAGFFQSATVIVRTNTAQQIRVRSSAAGFNIYLSTYGWYDDRGRSS